MKADAYPFDDGIVFDNQFNQHSMKLYEFGLRLNVAACRLKENRAVHKRVVCGTIQQELYVMF